MGSTIYATGPSKYVEFSAGHVLVNGQVLYIDTPFRVNNTDLVGSGESSNTGDYYVFLRFNRKPMEAYYSKNYEVKIRPTTSGGSVPTELPDEFAIAYIQKRLNVGGDIVLTGVPFNRGNRLIAGRHISDGAVGPTHISQFGTHDFAFPRDISFGRNLAGFGNITSGADLIAGDDLTVNGDSLLTGDVLVGGILTAPKFASANTTATLTATPSDGRQIAYLADSTNSVIWNLKYRNSNTRWEFVGGTPMHGADTTFRLTNSSTFQTSGMPSLTVPEDGTYDVTWGSSAIQTLDTGSNQMRLGLHVNGTVQAAIVGAVLDVTNAYVTGISKLRLSLTSGDVLQPRYQSIDSKDSSFNRVWISLQPVFITA